MTDSNLITVTEFGQFAPEVDTSRYDAPTISGLISQASKMVSDYLLFTPIAEDIVAEVAQGMVTTEGDLLIFPKKVPVITVTGISIYRGSITVDLNLLTGSTPRYNVDYTARMIRYPYQEITIQGAPVFTNFWNLRGLQFYTKLTYRGGWEVSQLPASIKLAATYFMRDLMANQYNQMGASRLSQGSLSFEFSNRDGKSKLIQSAERLLNPYRRVG